MNIHSRFSGSNSCVAGAVTHQQWDPLQPVGVGVELALALCLTEDRRPSVAFWTGADGRSGRRAIEMCVSAVTGDSSRSRLCTVQEVDSRSPVRRASSHRLE
jgi:hypothetical protein